MSIVELLLLAVGLSMDAFAVSIGNGLSMKGISLKKALPIALSFGLFQALMPLIGYFLGSAFESIIDRAAAASACFARRTFSVSSSGSAYQVPVKPSTARI